MIVKKLLGLSLAAFMLLSAPTLADTPSTSACELPMAPKSVIIDPFVQHVKSFALFRLNPDVAALLVAEINSWEPKSNWPSDKVFVYSAPQVGIELLVIQDGECYWSPGPTRSGTVKKMIEILMRNAS